LLRFADCTGLVELTDCGWGFKALVEFRRMSAILIKTNFRFAILADVGFSIDELNYLRHQTKQNP
jgi:hypothetical protein